ncbi:MAG: hypothetical protein ACI395_01995, partial [Candidatus Cryptobacteroides sp.]
MVTTGISGEPIIYSKAFLGPIRIIIFWPTLPAIITLKVFRVRDIFIAYGTVEQTQRQFHQCGIFRCTKQEAEDYFCGIQESIRCQP